MQIRKNDLVLIVGGVSLAVAALLLFGFGATARANPYDFNITSLSSATTSVAYLTAGTATSTLTYDSYSGGNSNGSEDAVLLLQFTASSTASNLNIAVQYSQDGIDWYGDTMLSQINSTTTPVKTLQTVNSYTWLAASTAVTSRAIEIPTPTRYMRAVVGVLGANAAVWDQFVVKKQQPE